MNFNLITYLPGLVLLFLVFAFVVLKIEKKFFSFVRRYWFYRRSFFSYLSTLLFLAGMGGLLISLLDLRGPEEKIKVEAPTARTIILIDTSASMLAEDVKPSRLHKAALIAKHFARKAAGQQLSIVAFAEIQKKIVPFTNDLDLIDARLDSLKNLRNHNGSSALSVAIQESIQYFRETESEARGNILVFTDGEETAERIDLKVPKDIRVALVGIGTEQGGRIPLDDGRGFRFGYKKDAGKDVITKLNENFFKSVVNDLPSAKYWLANTYSLPSEEILDFFVTEKNKGENKQDMVVKPVLMEWIVVPSVVLICLSYLFKSIRVFTLGFLLIFSPAQAQQEEPQLSPEVIARMDDLQKGELNQLERLKLADDLYRAGAKQEALELYEENLPSKVKNSGIPGEAYMNYGTALLEKGEVEKGLDIYKNLSDELDQSEHSSKLKEMMNKNVLSYFKQQEQKKKEQEKKKQDKNQDQDKNDQNNDQSQGQQNKDQNKESSGDKNKKDNKDNKGEQKDQKDQKKGDNNKEDPQDKKDEQDNKDQSPAQAEKKKMPQPKIPAKLKQLMSDDRQLQMKMIENGTRDLNRKKSRKSKDW